MKWFSLNGIMGEIKKIRWPKRVEISRDTFISIVFIAIFAAYFVLSDFVISFILRIIGVVA